MACQVRVVGAMPRLDRVRAQHCWFRVLHYTAQSLTPPNASHADADCHHLAAAAKLSESAIGEQQTCHSCKGPVTAPQGAKDWLLSTVGNCDGWRPVRTPLQGKHSHTRMRPASSSAVTAGL